MKKLLLILSLLFIIPASAMAAAAGSPRIEATVGDVQELEVKALHGAIEVSASADLDTPQRFMIFSITGQMVKDLYVAPGSAVTVELPAGYYIVKTARWSKRVLVK